jgi:hypothetical protein
MIIHMGLTMKAEEWPTLCLTELVYRSKEIVRGSFIKNVGDDYYFLAKDIAGSNNIDTIIFQNVSDYVELNTLFARIGFAQADEVILFIRERKGSIVYPILSGYRIFRSDTVYHPTQWMNPGPYSFNPSQETIQASDFIQRIRQIQGRVATIQSIGQISNLGERNNSIISWIEMHKDCIGRWSVFDEDGLNEMDDYSWVLIEASTWIQESRIEYDQYRLRLLIEKLHRQEKLLLFRRPDNVEIFARNNVSSPLYERDFALSPDGNEIMYTRGTYDQSRRCIIELKKTETGCCSKEIPIFSGQYQDIEPFYSPDGKALFFASDRPLPGDSIAGDYNIWKVERLNNTWADPVPVSDVINTEGDEFYPSVAKNGNLYFTATRKDGIGREDIFVSRFVNGEYISPEVLDTHINTVLYEFNAYISPDEELLIFSSYARADDIGGGDLYFSRRLSGGWSKSMNMGSQVNSPKLDYCPFIDYRNGNLYFTSERSDIYEHKIHSVKQLEEISQSEFNGGGNIFRIGLSALSHLLKPPE